MIELVKTERNARPRRPEDSEFDQVHQQYRQASEIDITDLDGPKQVVLFGEASDRGSAGEMKASKFYITSNDGSKQDVRFDEAADSMSADEMEFVDESHEGVRNPLYQ